MRNLNKLMLVAMFGLTLTVFADNAIYSKALEYIALSAKTVNVSPNIATSINLLRFLIFLSLLQKLHL